MSRLSIIIISWNTANITTKCVTTGFHFLPSAQIIVVDNASSDNTVALLKQIPQYPTGQLKIIINQTNLGYAQACNLGAYQATNQLLLFLNSDIEFIDRSIFKAIAYYQKHPGVGLIGPQLLNLDKTVQASAFPPQTVINCLKEYWFNQPAFKKYIPSLVKPTPVFSLSGSAILIKKSIFNQVNGWNQRYFFYYEDIDLCQRIHNLNLTVIYFPFFKLIHHHGFSGQSLAINQNQWRRLIPSSLIYHGWLKHYIIHLIIWVSQKFSRLSSSISRFF